MAVTSTNSRNVVIHVFDEFRKTSKDFTCPRELLLNKMKYFQSYLNQSNEYDEIDISVHCDVEIFEWLVEYMYQVDSEWKVRIGMENIASILVSSEFLQMDILVEECINFIAGRIAEFVQLRVDFGCLSDSTISRIADKSSVIDLDQLHDPKDKILSKLMRKKVESMLHDMEDAKDEVKMCSNCGMVYVRSAAAYLHCKRGQPRLISHGEIILLHQEKPDWNADSWIRRLVSEPGSGYSSVYWILWASTSTFHCSHCRRHLTYLDIKSCAFHPGAVVGVGFEAKYACCGARLSLGGDSVGDGCRTQEHNISSSSTPFERHVQVVTKYLDSAIARELVVDESTPPALVGVAAIFEDLPRPRNDKKLVTPASPEAVSPRRRKQWEILSLQERDKDRMQALTKRLIELRSQGNRSCSH